MKTIVNAGVVLAVLVGVLMFVNGFLGAYKNESLGWVFPTFATVIEVGVLIWGLRQTAAQGRFYGGQVGAGVLIALVGAALIIPISLVWTAMHPDVFEYAEAAMRDRWADGGMSDDQIEQMLQATTWSRTAWFQAVMGALATVVTGLVSSLILAIWVRKKD